MEEAWRAHVADAACVLSAEGGEAKAEYGNHSAAERSLRRLDAEVGEANAGAVPGRLECAFSNDDAPRAPTELVEG